MNFYAAIVKVLRKMRNNHHTKKSLQKENKKKADLKLKSPLIKMHTLLSNVKNNRKTAPNLSGLPL